MINNDLLENLIIFMHLVLRPYPFSVNGEEFFRTKSLLSKKGRIFLRKKKRTFITKNFSNKQGRVFLCAKSSLQKERKIFKNKNKF